MGNYICIFYKTTNGKSPVEDFIESLDEDTQDKFIYKKELLEYFGPQLRYPHTSEISEGIFELRFKGQKGQIRILFFFYYDKQIVLIHGFVKKTQKIPKKEINIAKQRKAEYYQREKKDEL